MATERSTEPHAALAEVDVGSVASDQHLVGLSMWGCILLGIAQAVVFPLYVSLPILLGAVLAVTTLLDQGTHSRARWAWTVYLLILPGSILLLAFPFVLPFTLESKSLGPWGMLAAKYLQLFKGIDGGTFLAALVMGVIVYGMAFMPLPAAWRLVRHAYPADTKRILDEASRVQRTTAVLQHTRFSLWSVPVVLCVPLLLALSFLLHLLVRPFGGPFVNRITMASQVPFSWIVSLRRFYKRHTQLTVEEGLAHDRRRPILLLRSFTDDSIAYLPWHLDEPALRLKTFTFLLEETLARELSRLGPPVAIGAPGETLPPIGAYRQYCSDTEWQTVVQARMAEAQLIVVIASPTRWLRWELERIVQNRHLSKCMLVFPPLDLAAYKDRVAAISPALSGVLSAEALHRVMWRRPIALAFGSNLPATAFIDKNMTKPAYALAVQAMLGKAHHPAEPRRQ